jgi:hypothetical protein
MLGAECVKPIPNIKGHILTFQFIPLGVLPSQERLKMSLCLIKHHCMKTYGGVEV